MSNNRGKGLLTRVVGWTPVIDSLAKEYGLMTAAVYGRVWRFCQMRDGVCRASLRTISEYLGIDRSTVKRHLDLLIKMEYINDLTPDEKHKAHELQITDKVYMRLTLEGVAQNNTAVEGVAENNTVLQGATLRAESVAESATKKVLKESSKKEIDSKTELWWQQTILGVTDGSIRDKLSKAIIDYSSGILTISCEATDREYLEQRTGKMVWRSLQGIEPGAEVEYVSMEM